jgi:phosphate acetyltransferase
VGNREHLLEQSAKLGLDISACEIIEPASYNDFDSMVNSYYEMRKNKGITREKAEETMKNPLFFSAMLVKNGIADGMVAGAVNSTANVLRPAIQIIKTKPGINIISSCFIMVVPDCVFGENGLFVFADCAVNPEPDAAQLAEIAVSSADTAASLCGIKPKVAMLSFSTKGSAQHSLVDKVKNAVEIAKKLKPDIEIDGEFQADAAIVESVGTQKAPGSELAGKANVLIFPDLQSGNIAYKLVQRLAKAAAIGPVIQGLNKPVNDLSRGCSVQDVVDVSAVTALLSY